MVSIIQDFCLQAPFHELMHEFGHAIGDKLIGGEEQKIYISPYRELETAFACRGYTSLHPHNGNSWKDNIIAIGGPFFSLAVNAVISISLKIFHIRITRPINQLVNLSLFSRNLREIEYAEASSSLNDNGDFGRIAQMGASHLYLSKIVIYLEFLLGSSLNLHSIYQYMIYLSCNNDAYEKNFNNLCLKRAPYNTDYCSTLTFYLEQRRQELNSIGYYVSFFVPFLLLMSLVLSRKRK